MSNDQAWELIRHWIEKPLHRPDGWCADHPDLNEFIDATICALHDTRERLEAIEKQSSSGQQQIATWIKTVLGEEAASNGPERALRLAEEAVELCQALGVVPWALHGVVDYVYNRPAGKPEQEIAGCQVTLYGAASALGVDVQEVFEKELARINTPEVMERVRRRQAEKRKVTGR